VTSNSSNQKSAVRAVFNRLISKDELASASVVKFDALSEPPAPVGEVRQGANHGHARPRRTPETAAAANAEAAAKAAAALQARLQAAHADGYANGYARAEADLAAHVQEARAQLLALIEQTRTQAQVLDADVAAQVIELSTALARQIVRAELDARPHAIADVVHEGLAMISETVTRVTLHLHPEDAALVGSEIQKYDDRVHFVEDITLERGGCRFQTTHGDIDATVTRRFAQAVAALGVPTGAPPDAPIPNTQDAHDDDDRA
jgi:flagellar assembly protein FliH